MDWTNILVAVLCSLFGGAGGAGFVLKYLKQRDDARASAQKTAYDQQGELIERMSNQLSTGQEQYAKILHGERRCREELAGLRSDGRWMYENLRQHHETLIHAGLTTAPLTPMPERFLEARAAVEEEDFEHRQSQHITGLLQSEAKDLR